MIKNRPSHLEFVSVKSLQRIVSRKAKRAAQPLNALTFLSVLSGILRTKREKPNPSTKQSDEKRNQRITGNDSKKLTLHYLNKKN